MLFYDNGRFFLGSVSFRLPCGVMIDTRSDEISGQGFYIIAPDHSLNIQIDCRHSRYDAYGEIAHNFDGQLSYVLKGEIEPITYGGLSGFRAFYENNVAEHEEYAFNINGCEDGNILDVYVMIRKDCPTYDENYKIRLLREILEGLKQHNIDSPPSKSS